METSLSVWFCETPKKQLAIDNLPRAAIHRLQSSGFLWAAVPGYCTKLRV